MKKRLNLCQFQIGIFLGISNNIGYCSRSFDTVRIGVYVLFYIIIQVWKRLAFEVSKIQTPTSSGNMVGQSTTCSQIFNNKTLDIPFLLQQIVIRSTFF